jgi:hypothetical protein
VRKLIVIGATGGKCPDEVTEIVKNRLHERWPDHVLYADDREQAYEMIDKEDEPPILAYAPGVFGDAVAGAKMSPKIWTGEPQVILTTTGQPSEWHKTTDPRQFLEGAMLMLGVHTPALNIENDTALELIGMFLAGSEALTS